MSGDDPDRANDPDASAGDPSGDPDGTPDVGWPVDLSGVTESVVATLGPNDRWNLAALGLHVAGSDDPATGSENPLEGGGVTARTWGRTRTRRNFERTGEGVVQFTRDPRLFVDAALGIVERDDPVHPGVAAWVRVAADRVDAGESGGTEWVDWRLTPTKRAVLERRVPTIDRGFAAVVEATVAASRLEVPTSDEGELLGRLEHLARVVESAGGPRERAAFERIDEHVGWTDR